MKYIPADSIIAAALLSSDIELIQKVSKLVDKLPGADVIERRTGEWRPLGGGQRFCTRCGHQLSSALASDYNFCPICSSHNRRI